MLSYLQIVLVVVRNLVLDEIWGFEGFRGYLEKTSEDVELKDRDIVIAGEVDGRFQSHGLQPGADGMHVVKALPEHFP